MPTQRERITAVLDKLQASLDEFEERCELTGFYHSGLGFRLCDDHLSERLGMFGSFGWSSTKPSSTKPSVTPSTEPSVKLAEIFYLGGGNYELTYKHITKTIPGKDRVNLNVSEILGSYPNEANLGKVDQSQNTNNVKKFVLSISVRGKVFVIKDIKATKEIEIAKESDAYDYVRKYMKSYKEI